MAVWQQRKKEEPLQVIESEGMRNLVFVEQVVSNLLNVWVGMCPCTVDKLRMCFRTCQNCADAVISRRIQAGERCIGWCSKCHRDLLGFYKIEAILLRWLLHPQIGWIAIAFFFLYGYADKKLLHAIRCTENNTLPSLRGHDLTVGVVLFFFLSNAVITVRAGQIIYFQTVCISRMVWMALSFWSKSWTGAERGGSPSTT